MAHHSRFNVTCECNKEEINADDDDRAVSDFSATHRHEIINNGSNSGHFWRDFGVLEF